MSYYKLYIVVREDVPDNMVPVLVAHTMLGAHMHYRYTYVTCAPYIDWLHYSFRKVVVKATKEDFDQVSNLEDIYLGYENTTCNGEKTCAIPIPVLSDKVPGLLRKLKLWSPK